MPSGETGAMLSNLDRYKSDLDSLVAKGEGLYLAMLRECLPAEFDEYLNKSDEEMKEFLKTLPSFIKGYQTWYSLRAGCRERAGEAQVYASGRCPGRSGA